MTINHSPQKPTRIEVAPQPTQTIISGEVLQVELTEDETVEWQWTHFADGQSIVTGYTIIKVEHSDKEESHP